MTGFNALTQPITLLPGIGTQTANHLKKLGLVTIQDLVFHLPHRYEDRTRFSAIGALSPENQVLIKGTIQIADISGKGRKSLICRITDGTGFINLRFFHFSASQFKTFKPGTHISCYGEVRQGYMGLEMMHPEYRILQDLAESITETKLTPVYPLTEGIRQKTLRKIIRQALATALNNPAELPDWLPEPLLAKFDYPKLADALSSVHAPDEGIDVAALQEGKLPALKRLAFEELLAHYLSLQQTKQINATWSAPQFRTVNPLAQHFLTVLPFQLTQAQKRVIAEIESDCTTTKPMMRLVQGDVGSGKTVVAAYAALLALSNGYQVAVMAPTELLAEQHFKNFNNWLAEVQTQILFLTGQLKGQPRQQVLQALADGSAGIVIGTHALFQDNVIFRNLGLIIIDEQHRFGVHQRMALRSKGQKQNFRPHQLVMTATPIPRTLAMLQYADLDLSIIDELPPGRKPVVTSVLPSERRQEVIDRIAGWVGQHKQAYWVCTLIEESPQLQCEAAEQTAENLRLALPDIRIGLIHGRLKNSEKDQVMQAFKQHKLDLLVATTVIEVGVDVANASLMIIENPERLGLSQLHQLRGRVGRGQADSFCLLLYQPPLSDPAKHRLGILRDSNDGFEIAEKDLQLRGPGEVMGTRQTGAVQFKIADLARDAELLDNVQQAGALMLRDWPQSVQPLIERWLGQLTRYAEV